MPRRAKGLSAAGLKHLPPGKHADGKGLYLIVKPSGRFWVLRYMRDGRAREMGLGPFDAGTPDNAGGRKRASVSLADARQRADEAQALLRAGGDPLDARDGAKADAARQRKDQVVAAERAALTFRTVADKLLAMHSPVWTSAKTQASWRLTLDKHAFPMIGDVPIADISREHVVRALSPVWTAQPATARKLQRRIAATLDYAAANGWRVADNPATGRVLRLTKALPTVNANGRRWPSLPWQRVPAFLVALDRQHGVSPLALRFAVLTALRSNEIRGARWNEFDFSDALWTIPGSRMKGGKAKDVPAHRVPLTAPMLAVLARAVALRTGIVPAIEALPAQAALLRDGLVFPSLADGPLSDATLGACIKRLNADGPEGGPVPWRDADGRPATAHGFRRSFRSWVDDERPDDAAAAEKALAHDEPNKVSAAYRGSDLLARRRALMEAWGAFCGTSAAAAVSLRMRPQNPQNPETMGRTG
jgi:integrase